MQSVVKPIIKSNGAILLHIVSARSHQTLPVVVNWNNVNYMEKTFDGTILHMAGGEKIEVAEYLEEVLGQLGCQELLSESKI